MICCFHQLYFACGYHLAVTDFLYARQNLCEGLEEGIKNHNAGLDLKFSSEEEMEKVDEDAVTLVEAETICIDFRRFVTEVIAKIRRCLRCSAKVQINFFKNISPHN